MALSPIDQVRLLVQDNTPGLYILCDDDVQFFLERNNNNVTRAAMDAAKSILLALSARGDHTVDIFSVKGSKAAESYRLALQLFLKDPSLNPVLQNTGGYVGGISKSEMVQNDGNSDNNVVPLFNRESTPSDYFSV